MQKFKAIILDLDGTVVKADKLATPSQRVIDVIRKANGFVKVSAASGRPFYLAKNVLNILGIEGPCVVNGGSQIIEVKTGKILFDKKISMNAQLEIFNYNKKHGYMIHRDTEDRVEIRSANDLNESIGKICMEGVPKKDLQKIIQDLSNISGVAAHPTTSWVAGDVRDIHITNKEATKKHAIGELLKILNVSKEETIGVGDSHNDIPLFESVGFKVLMGDGPDDMKEMADFIAPKLSEDGVATVIEKFILM